MTFDHMVVLTAEKILDKVWVNEKEATVAWFFSTHYARLAVVRWQRSRHNHKAPWQSGRRATHKKGKK